MADQQQLDLLQQGVKVWNTWRKQHPEILIELSRADLTKAYLTGADLSRADLSRAHLSRADLSRAHLTDAHLTDAHLTDAHLTGAHLTGAHLTGANLNRANLNRANLNRANLNGAELFGAHLTDAHLTGANLIRAHLTDAHLTDAHLSRADLSGANLSGADLRGAILRGADLTRARVGRTIFGNVDLRTVKGLETVIHNDPSTIGTDTLLRSEGDIPETFLRGAGLSDTFITYVHSLAQNPIEYYTCFMSYSSQDQEFAERLYADLQRKNIRCWFAPQDLKIGDEFRHRIEESIRLYDKLLVILSQHSIDSSWVEYEVKKALNKEQDQGKPALFPIALDEAIKDTPDAWAAAIRRKRHIGDFTKWKDHDAYQVAFGRLLRDLQASTIPPMRQS